MTPSGEISEPRPRNTSPCSPWESFFGGFPHFQCGDPYLDRYFDYRIYGLGLNRIEGPWGPIRHPAIAEGPEYFHVPIAYSAQCHMMEMRWRRGGREAWGSLLNFVDNQKPDGSFHGRLYLECLERTDFYHANWGDALLAVDDMHPDAGALARCYEGLSRYARWLTAARDPEASGMFTVTNHFETGQEYMSRYMAVDEEADVAGWRPRLRLKGIDVTVYAHQLFRALASVARRLERAGDEAEWHGLAARCWRAIDQSRAGGRCSRWAPLKSSSTLVHGADCASAPGCPRSSPVTWEGTPPPKPAAAPRLPPGPASRDSVWRVGRERSSCRVEKRHHYHFGLSRKPAQGLPIRPILHRRSSRTTTRMNGRAPLSGAYGVQRTAKLAIDAPFCVARPVSHCYNPP